MVGFSVNKVDRVRELNVYKMAFQSAMDIFQVTKGFPSDERYSLTDQIRRSSRSVCSNLAEAWRKRKYIAVFKNKLSDAMQEASETQTWLEFALNCGYIKQDNFDVFDSKYEQIFAMLITMDKKANTFCKY